jgi:hypothetical protein
MFRSRRPAAFAICLLLAVAHTWPLALAPGRYSLNHNADAELNAWILAWVAHQLPRDPRHLFDANIFYPAPDALAFSEPLIVPALMGMPLAWAGASPVLVYNLILILGLALTAFAAFVVIEAWTGSFAAGLLAGSALAFNTHTLTRLPHIQGIHIYGLALALLALDRVIRGGSYRAAMLLAASLGIVAYTSGYLIVFTAIAVAIALAARAGEWVTRARAVGPRLAAAAFVAALVVAPIYFPYQRAAREQGMVRSLEAVTEFSATPSGYLATAGRLHHALWSNHFFRDPVNAFFPGVTVLLLAVAAIAIAALRGFGETSPVSPLGFGETSVLRSRVVMLIAIGGAGVILSLGTATPIYGWVFNVVPPMQGLRAAARFGNLFLLAVALLAGLGLALWRPRRAVAAALVAAVNIEALSAPIGYTIFNGIPGIYRLLAEEPGRVVVAEQPFYPRSGSFQNARYVLASTAHWRPLMNGYSGYIPASYQRYADSFWYFPQDWAIAAMKDAGVTHVVVHTADFARDNMDVVALLDKRTDMELLAIGTGGVRLYRMR